MKTIKTILAFIALTSVALQIHAQEGNTKTQASGDQQEGAESGSMIENVVADTVKILIANAAGLLDVELGTIETQDITDETSVVTVPYSKVKDPGTATMHLCVKSGGRTVPGFVIEPQALDREEGQVEFSVRWAGDKEQTATTQFEVELYREYDGANYEMTDVRIDHDRVWIAAASQEDDWVAGRNDDGYVEDDNDDDWLSEIDEEDWVAEEDEDDWLEDDGSNQDGFEVGGEALPTPTREENDFAVLLREATSVDNVQTDSVVWSCDGRRCFGLVKPDVYEFNYSTSNPYECGQLASKVGAVKKYMMRPSGASQIRLEASALDACNEDSGGYEVGSSDQEEPVEDTQQPSEGAHDYRIRILNANLEGLVQANGKQLLCQSGACRWGSNDSTPSVDGCRKFQRELNGYVTYYGYRAKILEPAELHQCNGGRGAHLYTLAVEQIKQDKLVERNGMTAFCTSKRNRCTWLSSDSSPGVKGCKAWRKAVRGGDVSRYGYRGKGFSGSNLAKCNSN